MHHKPADAGQSTATVSDSSVAQEPTGADTLYNDGATPPKRTRSGNGKNIIFRVFPEEHDDIAARAAEAGLTISEFIRRVVTGHKTPSRFDYDVLEKLILIHTDMNRLGNLLKLTLKEDGGAPLSYAEREWQRSILESIEKNQELLRNYVGEFTA